jgi:hypothetical protein
VFEAEDYVLEREERGFGFVGLESDQAGMVWYVGG